MKLFKKLFCGIKGWDMWTFKQQLTNKENASKVP